MTKNIPEVLRLHALWLGGGPGGVRANLHDANLHYANLRGADLRSADLRGANLHDANLHYANLRGADLRAADLRGANLHDANLHYANLRGADLRAADLRGADLHGADLPDGYRIASLSFGGWGITVTPTSTSIGCQTHSNEDWLLWSPEDVAGFHDDAADWWRRHRAAVCAVIRDVMGNA